MNKTINQIPEGTTVTIIVMIGYKTVSFNTKVIGTQISDSSSTHYIITEPVELNGKRLVFKKHLVMLQYYDEVQGRTYTYTVEDVKYSSTFYCFYSKEIKSPDNTRRAFRVNCGYRTNLSLKYGLEMHSGFCKDVSFVGAGIFIQGEEVSQDFIGTPCTINIIDTETKECYLVRGTVVRVLHNTSFGTTVGIDFSVTPKAITDLVNRLQMKDLKKRSVYSSKPLKVT